MFPPRAPSEISFAEWLYLPPALVMVVLGFLATMLLTRCFNYAGISRYFWYPELAFLGLWILLSSLIGLFFLSP